VLLARPGLLSTLRRTLSGNLLDPLTAAFASAGRMAIHAAGTSISALPTDSREPADTLLLTQTRMTVASASRAQDPHGRAATGWRS